MRGLRVSVRALRRIVAAETDVTAADLAEAALARPKVRAHCEGVERPCPFVSCRHHLALDVTAVGSIWFPHGEDADLEQLPETCALDVADRGGLTLDEVARLLNVTRERVRQEQDRALERLRRRAAEGGR